MKLTIHHPRLLVAILLLLGVMTTSALLLADGGDDEIPTRFIPYPVAPAPVPLTDEQREDMVNIVKTSGVVELISRNQEWNVVRSRRAKVAGFEAASMIVAWDQPVDSSGPWVIVQCDGARQMFSSRGFTGITQLMVHVGLESREVLAYSVTGDPGKEAAIQPRDPNASMKFYDFKTGELVFDGEPGEVPSLDKVCPEGWEPRSR